MPVCRGVLWPGAKIAADASLGAAIATLGRIGREITRLMAMTVEAQTLAAADPDGLAGIQAGG